MIEVGETYSSVTYEVRDPDGVLADAGSVTYSMTLPTGFVQAAVALAHDGVGQYSFDYLTAMEGRHAFDVIATGGVLGSMVRKLGGDVFNVDSANTWVQLVGLLEAKEFLGKDPDRSDDDDELRRFIGAASELVENETRLWHRVNVVERLRPTTPLFLSSLPVVSVTAVEQGTTVFDVGTYRLDPVGALYPAYGSVYPPWVYTPSVDDVVVTYVAGEQVVPVAVREAVLLTLADAWETQRGPAALPLSDVGDQAEVLPRESWTLPPEALGKLAPWRKGPVIA